MENNYRDLLATLRNSHRTKLLQTREGNAFRLFQLQQLYRMYNENIDLILSALQKDMRKSKLEGYLYEVDLMMQDVREALRNLKSWMKETKLKSNILMPMDKAYIWRESIGVVLIISPFNYPFQLSLVPFCGALAAGNCVILKPSEHAPESAKTMETLIHKYLDTDCYRVINGGPEIVRGLLKEKFDHIFYTGNLTVAKEIHQMANKYLTPCTFELGGKTPCYICESADLKMTATRIMWGKCMNMGQTCVAPDYILIPPHLIPPFISHCKQALLTWYQSNSQSAPDLARIINSRHFHRLKNLITNAVQNGATIALGGNTDESDLWIEPTILTNVKLTHDVMKEEIFGPILPIYAIEGGEDGAVQFINSREKALCLYVFSSRKETLERFKVETRTGTVCCNDCVVHFAVDELPFGGIGESGYGYYHGKFGFDTFTHMKSIVERDFSWIGDQVGIFRYPPYSKGKINFLSFLLRHWKKFKIVYFDYLFYEGVWILLGIVVGVWLCKVYGW